LMCCEVTMLLVGISCGLVNHLMQNTFADVCSVLDEGDNYLAVASCHADA
jgi:hypothetical protein